MPELLSSFLVSASLGALLGLERQWSSERESPAVNTIAGARTFALWALIGCLCAWLAKEQHSAFFVVGFAGMIVFLSLFLWQRTKSERDLGLTTGAVGLATYLIGGMVYWGYSRNAVILTVSLLILLASKEWVHSLSRKFTKADVYQALQFAAVTGIVLPLVPDHDYGPYGAFNPWMIWLMVVLVSGLGFFGYVAVRVFGENRGIPFTGLLGGLASSTATTLAMSRQSRAWPETGTLCALAVVLACTVMLVRVAVLVGVISFPVLQQVAPWLLFIALPGLLFALWSWKHFSHPHPTSAENREVRNPLNLRIAIQFAILYALVVLLVRWANGSFGGSGVYWASFFSGLTDLDAISLSLAQLERAGNATSAEAARGLLIAAGANSLLKGAIAISLGSPAMRRPILIVLGGTVALSALAAVLI
jgi:uncharacterized membrane protein (DUF4010 family)